MKNKKRFKQMIILIITTILFLTFVITKELSNVSIKNYENRTQDKIKFLNVGSGDCILLESNGLLAIVDAGEDATGIRFLFSGRKGYTNFVVNYIKQNFTKKNGDVDIEFILGTHSHSDHLGNIDSIIEDDKINVKKLYVNEFHSDNIREKEKGWGMQEQYNKTVNAMRREIGKRDADFTPTDEPFMFGDFKVTFLNTKPYTGEKIIGENENSVMTVLEIRGKKICLTGDINNLRKFNGLGKEDIYGPVIGDVDILKLGHHGYSGSNSREFLETLNPEVAIITNKESRMCKATKKDLKELLIPVYSSCVEDGVEIEFFEDYYTLTQIK